MRLGKAADCAYGVGTISFERQNKGVVLLKSRAYSGRGAPGNAAQVCDRVAGAL